MTLQVLGVVPQQLFQKSRYLDSLVMSAWRIPISVCQNKLNTRGSQMIDWKVRGWGGEVSLDIKPVVYCVLMNISIMEQKQK